MTYHSFWNLGAVLQCPDNKHLDGGIVVRASLPDGGPGRKTRVGPEFLQWITISIIDALLRSDWHAHAHVHTWTRHQHTRFIFQVAGMPLDADQRNGTRAFFYLMANTNDCSQWPIYNSIRNTYINIEAIPNPCCHLNLQLPSIPWCPRPGPSGWTSESCTAPAPTCPGRF